MSWFAHLCRNLGLMVHNIRHPGDEPSKRQVLRKNVEERREGKVTLRRTTIEEIEFDREDKDEIDRER